MQRTQRLTGQKNFSNIPKNGRGVTNRLLVLRTHPNGLSISRFAFLTGKRIGNAVTRNRLKRRLREIARATDVKTGLDIIFIARRGSAEANFQLLKNAATDLLGRSGILEGDTKVAGHQNPPTQGLASHGTGDDSGNSAPQTSGIYQP